MFRTQELPRIPGTKIKNRFLYSSTGFEALDSLLGGDGAPSCSVILIDEPGGGINSGYSKAFQRYFLAEGVIHNHSVFVADFESEGLLENLPDLAETAPATSREDRLGKGSLNPEEDMKIAWRYSTVPKMESTIGGNKSKFDLNKKIPSERIDKCDIRFIQDSYDYNFLWSTLHTVLTEDQFSNDTGKVTENPQPKKFLRVLLPNLNQAYWGEYKLLKQLLIRLKVFSRHANVLIMVTVDSSLMEKEEFDGLLNYADAVFRLERMSEEEREIFLPEKVHGRFIVLKLPNITSIAPHKPELLDLTFNMDRHSFYIKILHLPPALGPEKNQNTPKLTGCQTFQNEF